MTNATGSTEHCHSLLNGGFTKANKESLFHAAHDIKGQGGDVRLSRRRLGSRQPVPPDRIHARCDPHPASAGGSKHVDAVRAIYREYSRSDAQDLAMMLTSRLRDVTDEFLLHENRDRPDVLEQITGAPSVVPE